jgi:hypothetical protein
MFLSDTFPLRGSTNYREIVSKALRSFYQVQGEEEVADVSSEEI